MIKYIFKQKWTMCLFHDIFFEIIPFGAFWSPEWVHACPLLLAKYLEALKQCLSYLPLFLWASTTIWIDSKVILKCLKKFHVFLEFFVFIESTKVIILINFQETVAEKCSNKDDNCVRLIQKCSQSLCLVLETLQTLYSVLKHQIERSISESVLGGKYACSPPCPF